MKKLLISFAALALLAACNNDDDDEKQPELLAKKIVKIEETYTSGSSSYTDETWEFTYDAKGRIAAIDDDQIEYGANTVKYDGGTHSLNDKGQTTKYSYKEAGNEYAYNYEYKNGYLSKTTYTETREGYSYEETYDYSFKGGNLSKLVYSEIETEEDDYYDTYEFTYGKQPNNMNIDLMDIIGDISVEGAYLLGIAGNRSVNLPEKMVNTWTEEDGGKTINYEDTYNYEYTVDKDGYITKITQKRVRKEDGKETRTETYTYTITYEK